MIQHCSLFLICLLWTSIVFGQTDSALKKNDFSIFEKITTGLKEFKLDTTTAPSDKITRKIIELRNLRGGFNINEAIDFKLEEDRQKNEIPKEEINKLSSFFKSGKGKNWLDNSVIWIYRQHFTYHELKQLVKFYKSPAGQKMADDFPLVMMQSLAAAEKIKEIYVQQNQKK